MNNCCKYSTFKVSTMLTDIFISEPQAGAVSDAGSGKFERAAGKRNL